jgi:hypothetical protein
MLSSHVGTGRARLAHSRKRARGTDLVGSDQSRLALERSLLPQCDLHERIKLDIRSHRVSLATRAVYPRHRYPAALVRASHEQADSGVGAHAGVPRGGRGARSAAIVAAGTHLVRRGVADRILRVRSEKHAEGSENESEHPRHRAKELLPRGDGLRHDGAAPPLGRCHRLPETWPSLYPCSCPGNPRIQSSSMQTKKQEQLQTEEEREEGGNAFRNYRKLHSRYSEPTPA